jgi:hypothetical protein
MKNAIPAIALLTLALSACGDRAPADAAAPAPEATAAADATAPADATRARGTLDTIAPAGDARIDGYGPLEFGMTAEEARAAWTAGSLEGEAPAGDPMACFHLSPAGQAAPSDLAFMFENDLLVRYSASSDIEAPGGGRRGMDEAALQALYQDALVASPHKYIEGGQYLSVQTPEPSPAKLVFALDADGNVTEWRAGVAPQVDYVEGCS